MAGRHTVGQHTRVEVKASPAVHARVVDALPLVAAAVVFVAGLARIRQRWFIPGYGGFQYTERIVGETVAGIAAAPNQYRPLMPWVMSSVADVLAMPLPTAILLVDAALLAVTFGLLVRLATRLGSPTLALAGAIAWGWWLAKMDHHHPETTLLTAAVTAAALVLLDDRPRWWALLALGALMLGARTDYAAGLGAAALALGVARRDWRTLATGLILAGAAVAATRWLVETAYPQAHYRVALVQLPYNLSFGSWLLVAGFYGPVLLALLVLAARRVAPPLWPVLLWFAAQFAVVFVVGRVEETRIFLPFAPALGVAAVAAYLELRARAETPSTGTPAVETSGAETTAAETPPARTGAVAAR